LILQMKSASNSKEVVMSYLKTLNEEDFKHARTCMSDDLSSQGPLDSRHGAEVYFKEMEQMRMKYDIKIIFVEGGDDVCVL
jgi:hypothetical protein